MPTCPIQCQLAAADMATRSALPDFFSFSLLFSDKNEHVKRGTQLEFDVFDAEYLRKLTAGYPETEGHFTRYFRRFALLKLRSRRLPRELAEDALQETLCRVFAVLRQGRGVMQPERFGAFVNAVCNNVLRELSRKTYRELPADDRKAQRTDDRVDIQGALITAERKRLVETALNDLKDRDREILHLVFFENADRKEICRRFNVKQAYLRVLVHRAKLRFHAAYLRRQPVMRPAIPVSSANVEPHHAGERLQNCESAVRQTPRCLRSISSR